MLARPFIMATLSEKLPSSFHPKKLPSNYTQAYQLTHQHNPTAFLVKMQAQLSQLCADPIMFSTSHSRSHTSHTASLVTKKHAAHAH